MSRAWKIGVVGATGAVGQEFLELLGSRRMPVGELRLFASSASEGKTLEALGEDYVVKAPAEGCFDGLDLVFFSAGSGTARALAPQAMEAGARVVDNSSAFRMNSGVPLVIPEINGNEITAETRIAAVPNCSTIILLMAVAPLRAIAPIRRIIVSTYQAASGAGAKAMQELIDQAGAVLRGESVTPQVLPHQIAFNVFSHDSPMDESLRNEEERKMEAESRRILGQPELGVTATCMRVPVLRAHTQAAYVEFDTDVDVKRAREVLMDFPGVAVVDDPAANHFPMPIEATGRDEVLVGRIRRDMYNPRAINLLISGDQLRKGAALNSIQIAELMREVQC